MDYRNMTLREKVLRTFIVTIREIAVHGGPKTFFEKYPVGGMYYMKSGWKDVDNDLWPGTSGLPEFLAKCRKYSRTPLLVCTDGLSMEGQTVKASLQALGGCRNEEYAYNYGKIVAMQLMENDVDWMLGPIVDMMYRNSSLPFSAMSNNPELTAKIFSQVIRGMQDQGICATAKHFPGLGTCGINMHFAPGRNTLDFDEWMASYGYVYKQVIDAGVTTIMTSHVTLRSYQSESTNGFYPIATYSEKLTTDLLKKELGFEGAVVTDALIMGGMATGDLVAETVQAFKAGADLLLWPPVEAADRIVELIEAGEIPLERLEDALSRIERMRKLREKGKDADKPDVNFANQAASEIIKDSICLLKNEIGLLPLNDKYKKILILDATEGSTSSEILRKELVKRGFEADVTRTAYDMTSNVVWQSEIDALQAKYDLIILNIKLDIASTWSQPFMLIWASHLIDKKKKLIINFGSPYFAQEYFPEDPTFIEGNAAPIPACIEALVDKITGKDTFRGYPVIF